MSGDIGKHRLVIATIGYHRHGIVILGGGTYQGHPADIDVLDTIGGTGSGGDDLGKRVKIAEDEVDRRHSVVGKCREVIRSVATRQKAGVDRRVKSLHPAVEHLAKA